MAFSTSKSLLSRIAQGDEIAWEEFFQTYRPLIRLRGGDFGLSETEKEELVQETVLAVFKGAGRFHYDPGKGRFRDYLKAIVNSKAVDALRHRRTQGDGMTPDDIDSLSGSVPGDLEERWNVEWREHLLPQSLDELRTRLEPETYQAFELYALEGWPPKRVADFLGLGVSSVYVAKSRAVEKLREIVREIEEM